MQRAAPPRLGPCCAHRSAPPWLAPGATDGSSVVLAHCSSYSVPHSPSSASPSSPRLSPPPGFPWLMSPGRLPFHKAPEAGCCPFSPPASSPCTLGPVPGLSLTFHVPLVWSPLPRWVTVHEPSRPLQGSSLQAGPCPRCTSAGVASCDSQKTPTASQPRAQRRDERPGWPLGTPSQPASPPKPGPLREGSLSFRVLGLEEAQDGSWEPFLGTLRA